MPIDANTTITSVNRIRTAFNAEFTINSTDETATVEEILNYLIECANELKARVAALEGGNASGSGTP